MAVAPDPACLDADARAARSDHPVVLVSAIALIDVDGRVLLAERPAGKSMPGLWEFPGGKVQEGETPEAALIREVREELGLDVTVSCLAPVAFASHAYDDFHLLMPLVRLPGLEGDGGAAGRPAAEMGAAPRDAGLSHAACG